MIWLALRQQRLESWIAAAVVAIMAAIFIPTGISLSDRFDDDGLDRCTSAATSATDRCSELVERFADSANTVNGLMGWFALVPLLIAILFAAPLVLELERGTYRLAWTQSITRRRWLTAKFAVMFTSAAVTAGVLATLWSWWRQPLNELKGRIEPTSFQVQGLAPVAYTLFATALVVVIGALLRRTIPTIGITIVAFLAGRIVVESWVRPSFRDAVARTGDAIPDSAWVLERTTAAGRTTGATFHPDDRFWAFQLIETGLFAGLSALLVAAASTWILRRIS